jgi:CRP-like cAMP-binding protein
MLAQRHGLSVLDKVAPFDGYSRRALAPLLPSVDEVQPAEGTVLAHEGWLVHEVLVVLAGEVVARRGGEEVGRFGAGAQIGAVHLLAGASHPVTLVAEADLRLVVINGPAYRWAAQTLPGWGEAA